MDDPTWRWDGWSNDWAGNVKGLFKVKFTNGDVGEINVARNIRNVNGSPVYLEDVDGTLYNWSNIISIRKQQE